MSKVARPKQAPPPAGTPIWVWFVYALGIFAAGVLVLSVAFAALVSASSDEEEAFEVSFSTPALLGWGVLVVVAAGTLVWRRRRGGR